MNRRNHDPSDPASGARQLFDRAVDRLDTATANHLRLTRRDALTAPTRRHSWAPATTAVAAVLVVAVVWWQPSPGPAPASSTATFELPPDATGTADEEDAELYAWLGDAPVAPDRRQGSL